MLRDFWDNPVAVDPNKLDRDLLRRGIAKKLIGITLEQLVNLLYSDVDAIVDFGRLCRGDHTCQKLSLLFNPHRLDTANKIGESVLAGFQLERYADNLARVLVMREGTVKDLLYMAIQTGISNFIYVADFPPHVARDIYLQFGAKRILDPCAGWGGRMIGAAAIGAYYHAFEPSTRTYNGLLKLGEYLKTFETGFDFQVENKPFEDAELTKVYDISLTSPPYYDTERYADESTQAGVRYSSFEEFTEKFYLPMVRRCVAHSLNGMVLNIGSRKYPMRAVVDQEFGDRCKLVAGRLTNSNGLGKSGEGEVFLHITGS